MIDLTCKICTNPFSRKCDLIRHVKTHDSTCTNYNEYFIKYISKVHPICTECGVNIVVVRKDIISKYCKVCGKQVADLNVKNALLKKQVEALNLNLNQKINMTNLFLDKCVRCGREDECVDGLCFVCIASQTYQLVGKNKYMNFKNFKVTDKNKIGYDTCLNYATQDENKGIFLFGKCGTGKTHLLASMANHYFVNKKSFRIIAYNKLIADLRDSVEYASEFIDELSQEKRLLIDDIATGNITEFAKESIFNLIYKRYENNNFKIVITSNLSMTQISNQLGERISSRLAEMCRLIELQGDDNRIKKTGVNI